MDYLKNSRLKTRLVCAYFDAFYKLIPSKNTTNSEKNEMKFMKEVIDVACINEAALNISRESYF